MGKILLRKQQSHAEFNKEIYDNIDTMFTYVRDAMSMMTKMLHNVENTTDYQINASYNKEREINNVRNTMRNANVENINSKHYEYQAGIYYMDIISDLERTGDYIINVVETIKDQFHKVRTQVR